MNKEQKEQLEQRFEEIRTEIKNLASAGNCKDMIQLINEQTEIMRRLNEIQLAEMTAAKKF